MTNNGSADSHPKPPQPRRLRRLALRIFSCVGLFMVCFLVVAVLTAPKPMDPLTQSAIDKARLRWKQNAPGHYRLRLEVRGNTSAKFELEVRDGQAVAAKLNGRPQTRKHAWKTWMVENQFEFVERELDGAMQPGRVFGVEGATVEQRVEFDPKYGFPRRYMRRVLGTALEIEWEITHFEPLR